MSPSLSWQFSCGHVFYLVGGKAKSKKNFAQPCPNCVEAQEETREKEKKAHELEQNAIKRYEAQATIIKQQIADAGDDKELREHSEKILENCKILWAGKVKMAESKAESKPADLPSLGALKIIELWAAKIKSADELLSLLVEGDRARGVRERSALYIELNCRRWNWDSIRRSIQGLGRNLGENTTLKQLDDLEKVFAKEWNRAVALMKEEKKK
jgi:hypothetical protein